MKATQSKILMAAVSIGLLTAGIISCGGGANGGGSVDNSNLDNTQTLSITGASTDPNFSQNGKVKVGFIAKDSGGNVLLASNGTPFDKFRWALLQKLIREAHAATVSCHVTSSNPSMSNLSCDVVELTSQAPQTGNGFASALLIDDSGSMSTSDPDTDGTGNASPQRLVAGELFINTSNACANAANLFGVFDFGGSTVTSPFTDTQIIKDFSDCSSTNITDADTKMEAAIAPFGGTPLYESLGELCTSMAHNSALTGKNKAILLLSDGQPNSDTNKQVALDCLTNNNIVACTVGLGPGSELDPNADPLAAQALKDVAGAGRCVYSAATDASALNNIFATIATAITQGQDFADIAVSPVPPSGTTVNAELSIGAITANFSFVAP